MAQLGFEPARAVWHSLGDMELNHQTIWTVAHFLCVCFDKDIFAYNSIIKVKLKILERVNLSFSCSIFFLTRADFELFT